MQFALGFIAGIAFCTFVAAILVTFRKRVERVTEIVERKIAEVSPDRPRGMVYIPESDAEIARQERIRENAERGADTPISELI